jgi:membrane-associated phospholipid phosphatase
MDAAVVSLAERAWVTPRVDLGNAPTMAVTAEPARGSVELLRTDWTPPVLQPRHGFAERVAARTGRGHPVLVFIAAMLGALALIATTSIVLGLLVTRVILHVGGVAGWDEHVNVWLAAHRTPFRTHVSLIGSIVSGGVVLPIVAGVTAAVCTLARKWRVAAFVVFALGVESASYRITTLAVHRHRPRVVRLEHLPVSASYPSGHTAASIAVYCGLALLMSSLVANLAFRVAAWTVAVLLVALDAGSRLYRGMHHPIDVAGGVVVGVATLCLLVLVCRASGAASPRQDERSA